MFSAPRGVSAIRVFAVAAALLLGAAPPQSARSESRTDSATGRLVSIRKRANELVAARKFEEAAAQFELGYREARARNDRAQALHFLTGLGSARFALFEYRQAIDDLARARELARSIGNHRYLSAICANLCNIYMQSGDLDSARSVAQDCLSVPAGIRVPYRPQLMATLGLLSGMSGDRTAAEQHLRDAVREAEFYGDDRTRFEIWNHYAQALFVRGDLPEAEQAALNAFRLGGLPGVRELRPPYLLLARIYRARGNTATAAALVDLGLAIPPHRTDRQLWRMYFLYERALLRRIDGQLDRAAADLRLALSYARDWREAIAPSDSLRSGAEFWLNGVYDAYIELTARSNPADAFLAVEEERSASLLQMLGDRPQSEATEKPVSETYWQDLARLRALEIDQIVNARDFDVKKLAEIRRRLSETEARASTPIALAIRSNTENFLSPETLSGIQRGIGPEEALFSFRLGRSTSFVWALTDQNLEMHDLVAADELVTMAERFRRAVAESSADRDRLGAELYSTLFGKISSSVLKKRSWIVTSDDAIFNMPFAALVVEETNSKANVISHIQPAPGDIKGPVYLVERHDTRRIPSAFLLGHAAGPPAAGPFLGMGDGIYNTADERWPVSRRARLTIFSSLFGASSRTPIELPRPVSSAQELKSCAKAWRTRQSAVFLTGPDLSREKIMPALRQGPAVIHIAAHVLYPTGAPNQALIHLGLAPNGEPEVLTSRDIAGLPASRALVVLSACSSAAGNAMRGAGVMGLTRSWLLAGARAVVGSRWPVPDDSGDLFHSFYSHMDGPAGRPSELSSAFQRAQLEMLHSQTWRSNPRYWGAFYLLTKE